MQSSTPRPRSTRAAPPPATPTWIVAAEPGSSLAAVQKRLEALGFDTQSSIPLFGTLVGSCPQDRVERLRSVPGVQSVSANGRVNALAALA